MKNRLIVLSLAGLTLIACSKVTSEKPNVVIILADDLG